jgi:periplasmic divalent cation tolerance protein
LDDVLLVFTTVPDESVALQLATALLHDGLAACVSRQPGVHSMYWWDGRIEQGQEWLLTIKTTSELWPAVERRCLELHPYEVPELLGVPATCVHEPYRRWLLQHTRGTGPGRGT